MEQLKILLDKKRSLSKDEKEVISDSYKDFNDFEKVMWDEKIICNYIELIISKCKKINSNRDSDELYDLVSICIIEIIEKMDKFDKTKSSLDTYIDRIIDWKLKVELKCNSYNYISNKKKEKLNQLKNDVDSDECKSILNEIESVKNGIDIRYNKYSNDDSINELVNYLSDTLTKNELFILKEYVIENNTFKNIGIKLNTSKQYIHKKYNQIKNKLRNDEYVKSLKD